MQILVDLMRRVGQMELCAARREVEAIIPRLGLDAATRDYVREHVGSASLAEILKILNWLNALLEQKPNQPMFIPVQGPADQEDRVILFQPAQVSYFFLGSAVEGRLIHIKSEPGVQFQRHRVYARAVTGIVYRTSFRSLKRLQERLGPRFLSIHQSLVVNLQALKDVMRRASRVGVQVGNEIEYLPVSRRKLAALESRILT